MCMFREKVSKRETSIVGMLQFIHTVIWKALFGKQADGLEQSVEDEEEFRILDKNPVTNRFVSAQKGSSVNCAAYISGIIEGVLAAAEMPAKVHAYFYKGEEEETKDDSTSTIFVIKFSREIIERDKQLQN